MKKLFYKIFLSSGLIFCSASICNNIVSGATFETLTVGASTAVGFTSARLTERPVSGAICTIETANVRILYGTTTVPTSSVGLHFLKDTNFRIENQRHMETFKVISTSGTATISVLYEP